MLGHYRQVFVAASCIAGGIVAGGNDGIAVEVAAAGYSGCRVLCCHCSCKEMIHAADASTAWREAVVDCLNLVWHWIVPAEHKTQRDKLLEPALGLTC